MVYLLSTLLDKFTLRFMGNHNWMDYRPDWLQLFKDVSSDSD
jgi:hypothetical protein